MPLRFILRLFMTVAFALLAGCDLLEARLTVLDCLDPDACDTGVIDTADADLDTDSDGDTDTDSDTDTDTSGPTDFDLDGYDDTVDCDDTNADVHPDAVETCNGIDDDCDTDADESGATGERTWYADSDGDGYGDAAVTVTACDQPTGYVADQTDCNDADGNVHPYADEDCDTTVDMNCDGSAGEADADLDGVRACEDCDDADASAFPGGVEVCDTVDNDCDTDTDESGATGERTWYADSDGDGYGDAGVSVLACSQPSGYVDNDTDCDDGEGSVWPGASEVCDSSDLDENCDGTAEASDSAGATLWSEDADADGYGNVNVTVTQCDAPSGYVATSASDADCDDTNAAVNVAAVEACNGYDDDCDGSADESGATGERTWYADDDGDGYGDAGDVKVSCDASLGYVDDATDCDDTEAGVNPAAAEQCDAVDNDCSGAVDDGVVYADWYVDGDGDGYGDATASTVYDCVQPSGYVDDATDCDDAASAVNPSATESCNEVDDDCDGSVDESGATGERTWYYDGDGDTYGDPVISTTSCDVPSGYVASATDCDDTESTVNPGASESCDSVDNDCDGSVDEGVGASTWYADSDGDGYGDASVSTSSCSAPSGYVGNDDDCDDDHAEVNPGASESKYTVWDDDCSGQAFTGLTLATGVVATSESFIADEDAVFDAGLGSGWELISDYLGFTEGDAVISTGTWANTLVGSYDGLEFFGTGGAAGMYDECWVYVGGLATEDADTVYVGDDLAIVFDLDSEAVSRYGISVYVGDAADTTTWVSFTISSSIEPGTDVYEIAIGTADMDDPDAMICAPNVEYDGDVRFTHVAVVTY